MRTGWWCKAHSRAERIWWWVAGMVLALLLVCLVAQAASEPQRGGVLNASMWEVTQRILLDDRGPREAVSVPATSELLKLAAEPRRRT